MAGASALRAEHAATSATGGLRQAAGSTRGDASFKRVAIVAPTGRSIAKARDGLIRELVAHRHSVLAVAPEMSAADEIALKALGAEPRVFQVKPPMLRALSEHNEARALAALLADWQPHVVLSSGGRLGPLGAIAARKAGVPHRILLVNGLSGPEARALAKGMKSATAAMFHNGDDLAAATAAGSLPSGLATSVVAGGGVDLAAFQPQPLPGLDTGLVFAMVSRIDRAHGVLDFCEAARRVRAHSATARFFLAGPIAPGADIGAKDIEAFADAVTYLGDLDDVRPLLARAHVLVYPSHREGMPRAVLEALAAARPVIATDVPGCRATVDERVNGCLVPPGDAAALASAMQSFLKRPDLIPAMSRASRAKAERLFDARSVIRDTLTALGIA
jgi:glycosyltransferase involved in cell wall biosynthesis